MRPEPLSMTKMQNDPVLQRKTVVMAALLQALLLCSGPASAVEP